MGLIVAAGVTTVIALGGLALLLTRAQERWPLTIAFLVALPLQPLAFYLVRLPFDATLKGLFGTPAWIVALAMFYAPLTEEPAKWLTALVPAVRGAIAKMPVAAALAVGLGFGIGEIWFLAIGLTASPGYSDGPFWMFGGFFFERLDVCFLHGAFVALPFYLLARGRPMWPGCLVGVVLHFLLNFPVYLAQVDLLGLGATVWISVLTLWIAGFVVVCALALRALARRYALVAPA
jgi:hypothetical protein